MDTTYKKNIIINTTINNEMKKRILAALALPILLLALTSCGEEQSTKTETTEKAPIQVKTNIVLEQDIAQIEKFTATIDPYLVNNISPQIGLRIKNILVEVGDRVRKGQVVVKMDDYQYMQANAQLSNLERDYKRMDELYKSGGISKQQLDAQKTQLDVSRHSVDNLKENAVLTSPISGVVTNRAFDPGDVYMPTGASGILTIMQIDRLKVVTNIPERYFPLVKDGMAVDIELEIFPGEVFPGKVSLVYPAIDASTRTFKIEVTVNNGDMKLRPGMLCNVVMNFGSVKHVLVPDIAVQKQQGSSERYVFVVNQQTSTVERHSVEVGQIVGDKYEIISGINNGDEVVIAGMQRLIHGDKVKVVK